jgi:FkbM family methyltransferase
MKSHQIKRFGSASILSLLLRPTWLRKRLVFLLKQLYFQDLELQIPIGNDLACPVTVAEHLYSFEETFLGSEYAEALTTTGCPNRWIDLGCHAGYFTLFVEKQRRLHGMPENFQALLIDADRRTKPAVQRLIDLNGFSKYLTYQHGIIADQSGTKPFVIQPVMASYATDGVDPQEVTEQVPVVSEAKIMDLLPPPYDLIKVDIEGSEYELIKAYPTLLSATKHLLMEWHSWHHGGVGFPLLHGQ